MYSKIMSAITLLALFMTMALPALQAASDDTKPLMQTTNSAPQTDSVTNGAPAARQPLSAQVQASRTDAQMLPTLQTLLREMCTARRGIYVESAKTECIIMPTAAVSSLSEPLPSSESFPISHASTALQTQLPVDGLATSCTVNKTTNSGSGSLRHCLSNAKPDTIINFDPQVFQPDKPVTITLTTPLPQIITNSLTIDGSMAGVILAPDKNMTEGYGLVINGADQVTIRGLQVLYFPWIGIYITGGASNNIIGGNRKSGTAPLGQGNLISGNGNTGIWIEGAGSTNNQVLGNYIGPDITGVKSLDNQKWGIVIKAGASDNRIGGETSDASMIGNLISGNRVNGINLEDSGTINNQVLGNHIGTDVTGQQSLGHDWHGIFIALGASNNLIGGGTPGTRNLISANRLNGVHIQNLGTTGNVIQGNFIGTNSTGVDLLGNGNSGILIEANASNNMVGGETEGARNIISGNNWGVQIVADANLVLGNFIGTDVTGSLDRGNKQIGVAIAFGGNRNVIGGRTPGARNIISGNDASGILIQSDENRVLNNYIGANAAGTSNPKVGNSLWGIAIFGSVNNWIGEGSAETRNVISGNGLIGISLVGLVTGTHVLGNYIGTDATGINPLPNLAGGLSLSDGATVNRIGDIAPGAGNVISGNSGFGISLGGGSTAAPTSENRIIGNYIGTDLSGKQKLANGSDGVNISKNATKNWIGDSRVGSRNVISANRRAGVWVQGPDANENYILGNHVGTDESGKAVLGNRYGIIVIESSNIRIGGGTPVEHNLISGNEIAGVWLEGVGTTNTTIQGNYIGTDISATFPLGNGVQGVLVGFGAHDNLIGGETNELRNIISGNGVSGVWLQNDGTTGNRILGNAIGTGLDHRVAIGNKGSGIIITENVRGNLLQNNLIHHSGAIAAWLLLGNRLEGNDFTGNRYNFVKIAGGVLSDFDETWTPQGELDTYLVYGNSIEVPAGRTWTISPRVNVEFELGLGATIQGILKADGTENDRIRFTAAQQLTRAYPGSWRGLTFTAGSIASLGYANIEFAENGLSLAGGAVVFNSSMVVASQQNGIEITNGSLTFAGRNMLAGNADKAINNQTSIPIQAPGIWWGSATGPKLPNQTTGNGDAISENVVVPDFLTEPMPKNLWRDAPILNPGEHQFLITSVRDIHWFRVPVGASNTLVTALLTALPKDYDLFLFTGLEKDVASPNDIGRVQNINLEDTGRVQNIPGQIAFVEGCSPMYIGQLATLGKAANTARLLQASCEADTKDERISLHTWDQTGWYYLLVAGHNGANSTVPYKLIITSAPGNSTNLSNLRTATFNLPTEAYTSTRTLILTNRTRLTTRYPNEVNAFMTQLSQVVTQPEIAGHIVDLGDIQTFPQFAALYQAWDDSANSPFDAERVERANLVAAAIKGLLITTRSAYPKLENILIIGGDEIVPFRRIPDEATIANEREYQAHASAKLGSPLAASLQERYFFSDNYYASFTPLPWRGRELFLPDYAIGRLVETPTEMMAALTTFQNQPTVTVDKGLVVGYDFMQDQAQAIAAELQQAGIPQVNTLINDSWQANELINWWLAQSHQLKSINAHFDHYQAIPPETSGGVVRPEQVQQHGAQLAGSVIFSVGCHAGLSVPDGQATANQLDFTQVLLGKGATYIANTGYGYGDADAIGYSERLMQLFTQELRKGATVGQALRRAKIAYLNESATRSLTVYDEKVLSIATLYGLPMYQVKLTGQPLQTAATTEPSTLRAAPTPCQENPALTCQQVTFRPDYVERQAGANGTYYEVRGETAQVIVGQPLQPRTSVTVTVPTVLARGALFEGGSYQLLTPFNPVVTRVITQTVQDDAGNVVQEPAYTTPQWRPTTWDLINTVRTPAGPIQYLVTLPAQYRYRTTIATANGFQAVGEERLFTELTYTLYYSTTKETIPPAIWNVAATPSADQTQLNLDVEVTDFSSVLRVVVAYTYNDGQWRKLDLVDNRNSHWVGTLPVSAGLEYFVQAVDSGGNVAVHDNKGNYFTSFQAAPENNLRKVYLPILQK